MTPTIGRLVWLRGRPCAIAKRESARIIAVHSDTEIDVSVITPDGTKAKVHNVFLDPEHGRHKAADDLYAEWMLGRAEILAEQSHEKGYHFHGG